jgi:diguanylate cyclase (GGDEF)-like protein/PAS domain S-box-containing protein
VTARVRVLAAATYLRYLLVAVAIVGTAFTIQTVFFYGAFKPRYMVVPGLVALATGLLLGHVSVLRQRLDRRAELFRTVADLAQEFTYVKLNDGSYQYASPSSEVVTGYRAEEFYATPHLLDSIIHPDDQARWEAHRCQMRKGHAPETLDVRIIRRDGGTAWLSHRCSVVYDQHHRITGLRATNLDITRQKLYQDEVNRLALYDPLTDLPNRRYLSQRIGEIIRGTAGTREHFAVLFLDLDRFKHINDTLGHSFGDQVLKAVGQRLRRLGEQGMFTCRFGGDEFVIVTPKLSDPGGAQNYAAAALAQLQDPFEVGQERLYLSGSIGISIYPFDGTDVDGLVRNADAAMYKSKRGQQGNVQFYSPELVRRAASFLSTENLLRRAIEGDEFVMHYQPQVDLQSRQIIGVEALARWASPDRGLVLPNEFITVAEETGLIDRLGLLVFEKVCTDLRGWSRAGLKTRVAINISGRHFNHGGLLSALQEAVRVTGCDPSALELEITEHALVPDMRGTARRLSALREYGVTIALDDFGTGYSSLAYIKRLPIDALKIDIAFVREIHKARTDRAIAEAIIALCRGLGIRVVAEGIEEAAQCALLLTLGCQEGQGYLFAKPMSAADFSALLRQRAADSATHRHPPEVARDRSHDRA